jgi:hypothetical protein
MSTTVIAAQASEAMKQYEDARAKAESRIAKLDRSINRYENMGLIAIAAGLAPILFAFFSFSAGTETQLGQFGDFLGGTTGGLFALAGFLYLVASLYSQQKQSVYVEIQQAHNVWALQNARYETYRQGKEQMLFVLTENLRGAMNRLSISSATGEAVTGVTCFSLLMRRLEEAKRNPSSVEALSRFWIDFGEVLRTYVGEAERVVDFIQSNDPSMQERLRELLNAQLTQEERCLLAEVPDHHSLRVASYFQTHHILKKAS